MAAAEPTVTFFAPEAGRASELARRLRAFSVELPADITQAGLYTQGAAGSGLGP